jgi:hypothetical protein
MPTAMMEEIKLPDLPLPALELRDVQILQGPNPQSFRLQLSFESDGPAGSLAGVIDDIRSSRLEQPLAEARSEFLKNSAAALQLGNVRNALNRAAAELSELEGGGPPEISQGPGPSGPERMALEAELAQLEKNTRRGVAMGAGGSEAVDQRIGMLRNRLHHPPVTARRATRKEYLQWAIPKLYASGKDASALEEELRGLDAKLAQLQDKKAKLQAQAKGLGAQLERELRAVIETLAIRLRRDLAAEAERHSAELIERESVFLRYCLFQAAGLERGSRGHDAAANLVAQYSMP